MNTNKVNIYEEFDKDPSIIIQLYVNENQSCIFNKNNIVLDGWLDRLKIEIDNSNVLGKYKYYRICCILNGYFYNKRIIAELEGEGPLTFKEINRCIMRLIGVTKNV